MSTTELQRQLAADGLERLAALVRSQAWSHDGSPSLPPTQAALLRMLAGAQDGLRARAMAQRLDVSAASISDSLKALEGKGWIVRSADATDRRAQVVRLTRHGSAVAGRLDTPAHGLGALVRGLDATDVAALLRVTQLLVAQAQAQGLATGMRTCLGCTFFRARAGDDPARPHLCGFTGQPFGDAELRADCVDQQPADAELRARNQSRFRLPADSAEPAAPPP